MGGQIVGSIILGAAALGAAYATVGRLLGVHRPISYAGGGAVTLTGELAIAGFMASIGGGIATGSPGSFPKHWRPPQCIRRGLS